MAKQILTREYLVSRLDYDASSGIFYHKHDFGSRYKKGDRADTPAHSRLTGYRLVNLLSQKFLAHRVAWMYIHGSFPDACVDHVNGCKSDNRIENLRLVDVKTNIENQREASSRSKLGILGVHMHQGRYRAKITVGRKSIHLGMFSTAEEAHKAYLEAKRSYHTGCTI